MDIGTEIIISSSINIDHNFKGEEKVIALCKALNADEYINPIGGLELYDGKRFNSEGINILFMESRLPEYKQFTDQFVPYLSIIDAFMFNEKDKIKEMLFNDFKLLHKDQLLC